MVVNLLIISIDVLMILVCVVIAAAIRPAVPHSVQLAQQSMRPGFLVGCLDILISIVDGPAQYSTMVYSLVC